MRKRLKYEPGELMCRKRAIANPPPLSARADEGAATRKVKTISKAMPPDLLQQHYSKPEPPAPTMVSN